MQPFTQPDAIAARHVQAAFAQCREQFQPVGRRGSARGTERQATPRHPRVRMNKARPAKAPILILRPAPQPGPPDGSAARPDDSRPSPRRASAPRGRGARAAIRSRTLGRLNGRAVLFAPLAVELLAVGRDDPAPPHLHRAAQLRQRTVFCRVGRQFMDRHPQRKSQSGGEFDRRSFQDRCSVPSSKGSSSLQGGRGMRPPDRDRRSAAYASRQAAMRPMKDCWNSSICSEARGRAHDGCTVARVFLTRW